LTNIPKLALSIITLKHQNFVDHKITKIARSVLGAFVFALGHKLKGPYNGMLIPQFLNGLITASQYEKGESFLLISIKQFIFRSFLKTIFGGKYN
jgi:hypothetical protein